MSIFKKSLMISAGLVLAVTLIAPAVNASRSQDDTTPSTERTKTEIIAETKSPETETEVHKSTSETEEVISSRDRLRSSIEDKQTKLESEIQAKRSDIKSKLDAKRLDICKQRETQINGIIARSVSQNKQQLGVFERIEVRVKAFYTDHKLNAADYDNLISRLDDAHSAAVAGLNTVETIRFSCDTTDASNPGGVIKNAMIQKNDALAAYKTALKNLIVAIKNAAANSQPATQGGTN